ncbi:MAG TPA: MBL fold metallo-hydrolase [Candidatus Norongarragalinales archaeon]|jgi:phosphoribosyl 1,2-cyclic phosphodiesterase|nr:MBL fold metallo-hydrolase [Candidatus Norongarragalinales archaeon]
MELVFIGIGGGRAVTDTQAFPTGGFRINCANFRMHCEPGPGALVKSIQYGQKPSKLDAIFASHAHLDHANDLNAMIEAMTFQSKFKEGEESKKGALYCSKSITDGAKNIEPALGGFFKKMLKTVKTLKPGEQVKVADGVTLKATKAIHEDPATIGFILDDSETRLGYTGDTQLFPGLFEQYEELDALIVNVLKPEDQKYPFHLGIDEAANVLRSMANKPKQAFINHLGMSYLRTGTNTQASRFQKISGIKTTIARESQAFQIGPETKDKAKQTRL